MKGFKVIVIPSMRTPKFIIDLAVNEFSKDGHVLSFVDKQAYLSALALANYIVVTSDSTSMISEAATSGKPIFVAHMKPKKNNYDGILILVDHLIFKKMGIEKISSYGKNDCKILDLKNIFDKRDNILHL